MCKKLKHSSISSFKVVWLDLVPIISLMLSFRLKAKRHLINNSKTAYSTKMPYLNFSDDTSACSSNFQRKLVVNFEIVHKTYSKLVWSSVSLLYSYLSFIKQHNSKKWITITGGGATESKNAQKLLHHLLQNTQTLRGYCTSGPYFWRLCAFSQKINQIWTKYLMDLVRNVLRNSKITVLLQ